MRKPIARSTVVHVFDRDRVLAVEAASVSSPTGPRPPNFSIKVLSNVRSVWRAGARRFEILARPGDLEVDPAAASTRQSRARGGSPVAMRGVPRERSRSRARPRGRIDL